MKPVYFLGDSQERLRSFPENPRRQAGFQLDRLQRGLEPDDFKPMKTVGKGVEELRVRDASGAYRVIYLARTKDGVFVLHAFKKTTRRTSKADIELAQARLRELHRR
ncbi:MAG TPA: type II toxin-antitoxin system RelE/ParE family toxin [Gammaproteobacteria bacterium]